MRRAKQSIIGRWVMSHSKYKPHEGRQEKTRRRMQIAKGMIKRENGLI